MTTVGWDDSLRRFLERAASADPTPGGGSAAAVAAALGTAMSAMASHLTQGDKFAEVQHLITPALDQLTWLSSECEELLAADIRAFDQYMAALKLPRATIDEKLRRKAVLHDATISAIDVPLRLMRVCRSGLQATQGIAACTNPHVISDLGIGAILLEAAAQSALLTVQINLAALKDDPLGEELNTTASTLIADIEQIKNRTLAVVRDRI
ncbi:cyclodeaminase/cyclohydrolase family protein [Paenibacillus sp. OV219]|uniref:cyclodeaminase/cyclohydrolase family protein n=1 Tax=Paenibacillus sp. OV219 TaxID=1884377 RepID=UPI0008D0E2ED|nr:cyclodeaminase/cyclohydrolase family protein [Paenibacillus sp. OV219]SEO39851.1 Formimidoyltetrahydrofolate cyclodeaminase [Paenibacillus sp. OV219]